MKERNLGKAKVEKDLYETDKAFDDSMVSLISWLSAAQGKGLLSIEKMKEIFKEELKSRRDHEI